jgi:1-acylglycerone phosphate reductase
MDPKYVLITGCSTGGIGHAIALSFQKRGYTVFATVRKAENTLKDFEDVQILDVTSPKSVATVVEYVKDKTGGKLDVLVNNAGQQFVTPALDVNIDAAKELFEVNYWGPLRMMQEFSSMLIAAKGCVVNVTSTAALLPMPIQSKSNIIFRAHMLT